MNTDTSDRPAPEAFLREAAAEGRGRLKVFLGAAPGVGKTFEMLEEGAARRRAGTDVVVGIVETHGRAETEALTAGHEIIPRLGVEYQGRTLTEMDLDAVLARHPQLVLVDELAHTNAPGSRHPKRYQDVEELLAAGIDVFSTINIQHIESLNDVVASFTRVRVRETVPDSVLETAEIEVVDIPPDELIARLKDGKVYVPEEATRALQHFFSKSNLSALRELALRRAAQTVDAQMLDYVRSHALAGTWAGADRIVVAVSELAGADGLIRAAKRLADAQHAPWVAVHVETARSQAFGDAERQRIAATMHLATQLGGTVASIPAESVLEGLKRYTLDARATQLIVGKSTRSRWFELRHGSVVDRLVRETPGVAIHVLPMEAGDPLPARSAGPPGRWGKPMGYVVTAALVAAVTIVGVSIHSVLNLTNLALLYLLPVFTAAAVFGLRTGLVAGVASSLAYNFFFLPPRYTLTISDPENVVTVFVLLAVAVAASQLAERVRVQAELARRAAEQNAALAGLASTLTPLADTETLGRTLCEEVARLLDVAAVLLLPGTDGLALQSSCPPDNRLETLDWAAARWAMENVKASGRGSDTLTGSEWQFRPLVAGGRPLGVLGVARGDSALPVRSDQLPLLVSLLDQAALALDRILLVGEMGEVARLKERDRLRAALLSSLGHDLRTPLTAMMATIAELRRRDAGDPGLIALDAETQRLNRFFGNLLDLVRIQAGGITLASEPVDLTDAVAAAVHDLKRSLADHPIRLDVSPDLPLVRLDPQLFHHCLINLLDNAGKYADPGTTIAIVAVNRPDALSLSIVDQGPGLPEGRERNVFDTFARFEGSDRRGGTGLGLAIVKGFAEAMGLDVSARTEPDPLGACFTLSIPRHLLIRAGAGQ